MKVKNIFQLSLKERETSSLVSRGMRTSMDFTQPEPIGGPSVPLKDSIALAQFFATNLGSNYVNPEVVSEISEQYIKGS